MEVVFALLCAICTILVSASSIEIKKNNIAYIHKRIELLSERILILKELSQMDDKMENFIIDSIKELRNDVSLLKIEMAKTKVYVAIFSGSAAFIAVFAKDLIMKFIG